MTPYPIALYQGRILSLYLELARLPDGREIPLEVVRHPGGAAVVALDGAGRVCLLRQYRHVAQDWLWELPAGRLDPGEAPATTAARELLEEAGMVARCWASLGWLHSSPGVFAEVIHLFLAQDLEQRAQALGADELLEVHWLPLSQALEWADQGRISDAKTLVGLYRGRALLEAAV